MAIWSLIFGGGKGDEDGESKGHYENPKDRWGLGRDAAEAHRRWTEERFKALE
ncbi:MAG: hypothetical protein ACMG5Z_04190 [Luteimonas sp.]